MQAVRWWRRYLNEAPDGLHVDEARAAVDRMDRRFQTLRGAGIGLAAFALVAGLGLALRRRRGLTLDEWLRRDPGRRATSGPCSAASPTRSSSTGACCSGRRGEAIRRRVSGRREILAAPSTAPDRGPGSWRGTLRAGRPRFRGAPARRDAEHPAQGSDPRPRRGGYFDELDAARDALVAVAAGQALPEGRRSALASRLGRAAEALPLARRRS